MELVRSRGRYVPRESHLSSVPNKLRTLIDVLSVIQTHIKLDKLNSKAIHHTTPQNKDEVYSPRSQFFGASPAFVHVTDLVLPQLDLAYTSLGFLHET